jgi:transcriptional regulator NrdR family protein
MECPICRGNSKIEDSVNNRDHVVRYRLCQCCDHRWKTIEVDADMLINLKKEECKYVED